MAIVDEIAGNLRLEMDLAREARFVRRFADAWRGSPDIVIPDATLSSRHAQLEVTRDAQVRLLDLGSTNGTLVNGRLVSVAVLGADDRIQLGTTTLTYRAR